MEMQDGQAALKVRPFDRGVALPLTVAAAPPSGWTTSDVLAAATSYARQNNRLGLPERRLVGAAYRALMSELPDLKRAEIVARLKSGADSAGATAHIAPPPDRRHLTDW